MFPTVAYIQTQYLAKVDDPNAINFTADVFQAALNEAYDAMFSAFLNEQCPAIINEVQGIVCPAFTTSLTPAQMGISNFADYEYISERPLGSGGAFSDIDDSVERLYQRPPYGRLGETEYRNGTFYFIGATQPVELKLRYQTSSVAPTSPGTSIMVDSCATFLVNFSIGCSAGRKGKPDLARECMSRAVGPRYDSGVIGGDLFRLINPLVRERQHVPMVRKPFSISAGFGFRRRAPYIVAPTPQSGSIGKYSTYDGGIVGLIDGTNRTFTINAGNIKTFVVFKNGSLQTPGLDYTALGNTFTFTPLSTPQPSGIVSVDVEFGAVNANDPVPVVVISMPINVLTGSVTPSPVTLNDGATVAMTTITVPGALPGYAVTVQPAVSLTAGVFVVAALVTAPNVVSWQLQNLSGATVTVSNTPFKATVIPNA